MLTKEQIEQAAEKYCTENRGGGFEFQAFLTGAEWAAEQMKIKNDRLTEKHKALDAENLRLIEQNAALKAQNEIFTAAIQGLVNHIVEIDNENQ